MLTCDWPPNTNYFEVLARERYRGKLVPPSSGTPLEVLGVPNVHFEIFRAWMVQNCCTMACYTPCYM